MKNEDRKGIEGREGRRDREEGKESYLETECPEIKLKHYYVLCNFRQIT